MQGWHAKPGLSFRGEINKTCNQRDHHSTKCYLHDNTRVYSQAVFDLFTGIWLHSTEPKNTLENPECLFPLCTIVFSSSRLPVFKFCRKSSIHCWPFVASQIRLQLTPFCAISIWRKVQFFTIYIWLGYIQAIFIDS